MHLSKTRQTQERAHDLFFPGNSCHYFARVLTMRASFSLLKITGMSVTNAFWLCIT
jgi:hypothetical protein